MSIITTYPGIVSVSGEDLLVIADMSVLGTPTRTVRVDQLIGTGGGGGGTVLSVNGGNSSFINIAGGPITVSGTLTASLSATGTPSSSTYLRGDNTWATIPGGNPGTVTEVGVSSNYLTIGNTPITSNGTISVNVPVSGVAAGNYTNANITVDQYGFVTAAANGSGGGSGTVTSVTGQDGIVMTGSAAAPVVNVDYLGADNYILTAANPDPLVPTSREASMNFSTERTSKQVYHTTLADIVDTGNGYKMTAFRLDVASAGATPTITMISNHIGGTWSISRIGVGEYNITNSNGGIFTDKTICYINNPNITGTAGATTNVFPQATNIRRKAATLISVECFEVGSSGGNRGDSADFGTANPIYVEIKIYD